jgi:hypothetical protein
MLLRLCMIIKGTVHKLTGGIEPKGTCFKVQSAEQLCETNGALVE